MTVSDTTPAPGESMVVTADGYQPATSADITIESVERTIGTATATAAGRVSATVTIPLDIGAGQHTIRVRGTGADGRPLVQSRVVTVTTASTAGLARTGSQNTLPLAAVGLSLLAGGFVLRRSVKNRKTSAA